MNMSKDTDLMALISRVMKGECHLDAPFEGIVDDFYAGLNAPKKGFNAVLLGKSYPAAPKLIGDLNDLVNLTDTLSSLNMLFGKKTVYISSRYTTRELRVILPFITGNTRLLEQLTNIKTNLSIIVYNAPESGLFVQNHMNQISAFSPRDLRLLADGCWEHNISLYKIVANIIIAVPMKEDLAFIIESHKTDYAFKRYALLIAQSFILAEAPYDERFSRSLSSKKAATAVNVCTNDKLMNEAAESYKEHGFKVIQKEDFYSSVTKDIRPAYVSLHDHFLDKVAAVQTYYSTAIRDAQIILNTLTADITIASVTEEDKSIASALKNLSKQTKEKIKQYSDECTKITNALDGLSKTVSLADEMICPKSINQYFVSRKCIEPVLRVFFAFADSGMKNEAYEMISRLRILGYQGASDTERYLLGGNACNGDEETWKEKWEYAKMFLNSISINPKNAEPDLRKKIEQAVKRLEHVRLCCYNAKELYYFGMCANEQEKKLSCLKEAYRQGYAEAAVPLWEYCQNIEDSDEREALIEELANMLIPDACRIMTTQAIKSKWGVDKNVTSMKDESLIYNKLLAARGNLDAIGEIVDLVYYGRFDRASRVNPDNKTRLRSANVLILLCSELISNGYNEKKYSEIKGIILYSLNHENPDAFDLLKDCAATPAGHYCLGCLYLYAPGRVVRDLSKAEQEFKKCLRENTAIFKERIDAKLLLLEKIKTNEEAKKFDESLFNSNKDYSSKVTPVESYEEGCVTGDTLVIMADGSFKRVDELTRSDTILAWDMVAGKPVPAPLMGFHQGMAKEETHSLSVKFEDGTAVSVIGEHLFFDLDLNRFIAISDSTDIQLYIGHRFAKASGNGFSSVKLISVNHGKKVNYFYAPVTQKHLTYMVNGMISANAQMLPLCNRFEMDSSLLRYDPIHREHDLSLYPLLSYDAVKDLVSREFFEQNNADEFGVAIAKQLITLDELINMIITYREYLYN